MLTWKTSANALSHIKISTADTAAIFQSIQLTSEFCIVYIINIIMNINNYEPSEQKTCFYSSSTNF